MSQMMKRTKTISYIAIFSFLTACAQHATVFDNPRHNTHPAAKAFHDYAVAAKKSTQFMELIDYFSPSSREAIPTLRGWYRMSYAASWYGLRTGQCTEATLRVMGNSRAEINCKGSFLWQSSIIGDNLERMQVMQRLRKVEGKWKLEKSGMQHTQFNGDTTKMVRYGLIFKHSLPPQ